MTLPSLTRHPTRTLSGRALDRLSNGRIRCSQEQGHVRLRAGVAEATAIFTAMDRNVGGTQWTTFATWAALELVETDELHLGRRVRTSGANAHVQGRSPARRAAQDLRHFARNRSKKALPARADGLPSPRRCPACHRRSASSRRASCRRCASTGSRASRRSSAETDPGPSGPGFQSRWYHMFGRDGPSSGRRSTSGTSRSCGSDRDRARHAFDVSAEHRDLAREVRRRLMWSLRM